MTISPAQTGLHGQMEARHISVGLGLLAVAISLFGGALTTLDQPASAIAFGSVALAAYAAGLLCLIGGGRGAMLGLARWQFGPWILLWCGAAFGLATLTWTHPQTGLTAQIAVSSVLRALWMVASGITAWAVGYVVGPGRVIQCRAAGAVGALSRRFAGTVRGPAAPWILYAIGVTARLVLTVTTGHFGYVGDPSGAVSTASGYQQILNLLSLCAPLAVACRSHTAVR